MEFRTPWESDAVNPALNSPRNLGEAEEAVKPKPKGRRPAPLPGQVLLVAPFWRYNQLTIIGDVQELSAFAAQACGPGVIPWQLDLDAIEEDIFNLAVAQPPEQRHLTVVGCRLLARQFRERVETRQALAARIGSSRLCPFDLQVLLPVPSEVLSLGPTQPDALAWLQRHWGTTDGLRHVEALPKPQPGKRLPAGHSVLGYGFFTMDQPPTAALSTIAGSWPSLHFRLRHRPTEQDGAWTG